METTDCDHDRRAGPSAKTTIFDALGQALAVALTGELQSCKRQARLHIRLRITFFIRPSVKSRHLVAFAFSMRRDPTRSAEFLLMLKSVESTLLTQGAIDVDEQLREAGQPSRDETEVGFGEPVWESRLQIPR